MKLNGEIPLDLAVFSWACAPCVPGLLQHDSEEPPLEALVALNTGMQEEEWRPGWNRVICRGTAGPRDHDATRKV